MKGKTLKFSMLSLGVLAGGLLSSCTVNDTPARNESGSLLKKAPKIEVYSGSGNSKTYWEPLYATRGNQDAPYWTGTKNEKPDDITQEELEAVVEYFKTHEGKSDAVEKDFKNFYVQQVYYTDEKFEAANGGSYDAKSCVNQINTGNSSGDNVFGGSDDFNKCRYLFDSSTLDFWYNNTACGTWINNFKMVFIPGHGYFVGFNVEGKTPEEAGANTNQILPNDPDEWYYDRIIKIVPADENGNILPWEEIVPENPGDENLCPECGDPQEHHDEDGVCSDCKDKDEEGPCYQAPEPPENPENPGGDAETQDGPEVVAPGHNHNDEVEVNLHGTDKGDILESHLSIHVRAATDVEIFIPVPAQYYCDKDDMEIVMKHENNHMIHDGTYTLKDSNLTVTLTIAYEDDGIRITTDGITQEVIDWCMEKCQDGITFEIWNYFDSEVLDLEALKEYLNQATIKFLDKEPDAYINAFTEDNGNVDPNDCTVSIVEEQSNDFAEPETGSHLNGSTKNEIFKNKNAAAEPEE